MFDILWISTAFICGALAVVGRLPPMIGFLGAGFILHFLGIESFTGLEELSELGVSLLLFSIGLKLDLKSLVKPEILGVALAQAIISFACLFGLNLFLTQYYFSQADPLSSSIIAFALSFSSTIFVVKILEQRGDFATRYGTIAIGILIIQDILAVLFMAFGVQKAPSAWLLLLLTCLWPLRVVLSAFLTRLRHNELLVLFGLTISFGGAYIFDLVNVKGDIGALVLGVLLSKHKRSSELNNHLMSFKNFFLLGFFLSTGMIGLPTWNQFTMALALCLFIPLRLVFYFFAEIFLGLRNRTSFLTSIALGNYSEFGLIVCSFAVSSNLIEKSWLTTLALALSFSFIFSALLNSKAEKLYRKYSQKIGKFQRKKLHPQDREIDLGEANVLIIGMGRVGRGAYAFFKQDDQHIPLAMEVKQSTRERLKKENYNIIYANATSPDYWHRVALKKSAIKSVLLAMPLARQNSSAAQIIREIGFKGNISSIAKYTGDEALLKEQKIDHVFNLYAEAGSGFANSVCTDELSKASNENKVSKKRKDS